MLLADVGAERFELLGPASLGAFEPILGSSTALLSTLREVESVAVTPGDVVMLTYTDGNGAQQTAQPIADVLGLSLQLRESLRERSYGAFQGHDSDEINDKFPAEYIEWQTRDPGFAPPGDGESQRVFYHRIVHAMEPIVAAHPVQFTVARQAVEFSLPPGGAWSFLNLSSIAGEPL